MIKLIKGNPPDYLTEDKAQELTEKFSGDSSKRVWHHESIKQALLQESHGKCAYCETFVDVASSYVHIDHHLHKDEYPELVADWGNFVPACERCNKKKGDRGGVLNPYYVDPKEHLTYRYNRFGYKTDLGLTTRTVLGLNDERINKARIVISDTVNALLSDISEEQSLYKIKDMLSKLLDLCQPEAAYSVACSAILHGSDSCFNEKKSLLEKNRMWDEEMEERCIRSQFILLN